MREKDGADLGEAFDREGRGKGWVSYWALVLVICRFIDRRWGVGQIFIFMEINITLYVLFVAK